MSTPGKRRSTTWNRKRAITHRLIVLSVYRFFGLFVVGILPLAAHTLISLQTESAAGRTWVAPELWLLSLVMWGAALAETLAQESGGLRPYLLGWAGFFGAIGSAYAYGSLLVHAPAAKGLNELFQRLPIHATIVAVLAFATVHYPEISAKAVDEVDQESRT